MVAMHNGPWLLDVNVLLALALTDHTAAGRVRSWFERHGGEGWATCPLTQTGFVRLLSNPVISGASVGTAEALTVLGQLVRHSAHKFWPDELELGKAVAPFGRLVRSHRQVTDAYLFGLALHHGGGFVTLDRGIRELLASDSPQHQALVVLQ